MSRAESRRCRAIVFDLDDTLYPQSGFKLSGFRAVADWAAGRFAADAARVYRTCCEQMALLGPSHPRILDAAFSQLQVPGIEIEDAVDVFRSHRPQISVYPGVVEMFERLQGELRLGLLTDGTAAVQRRKVEALGISSNFDGIWFSDDLGTAKPDPTLFDAIGQHFGLSGSQLVYVGDNPRKDFIGARQRNWLTVRVRTGEHAAFEAITDYDAIRTIDYVADLSPGLLIQLEQERSR
jgi:putative hydrolase of the HAD superfamily